MSACLNEYMVRDVLTDRVQWIRAQSVQAALIMADNARRHRLGLPLRSGGDPNACWHSNDNGVLRAGCGFYDITTLCSANMRIGPRSL